MMSNQNNQAQFQKQQKNLLVAKAHEERIAFLSAILNGESKSFGEIFAEWGLDSDPDITLPRKPWDEETFKAHPWTGKGLEENHKIFAAISANDLRRVATWYSIHIKMVEAGKLSGHFFGYARKKPEAHGVSNIENALKSENEKEVEACARNILRNMGGVVKRGHRTPFTDCPTCKFYWNYRLAKETVETFNDIEMKAAYEILAVSGWRTFIESIVSRLTVVGDMRIRQALIAYFVQVKGPKNITEDSVEEVIREVGQMTTHRHLGFLESKEILAIFKREIKN